MYNILIVDDTTSNLDVLTDLLKDTYLVSAAINGPLALKIAEKTLPDLILLDIMMPVMDGYEVCRRLKANPVTQNIPVIFITAKDQELDELTGFSLGAVDYITKPISPLITRARIKTQLTLANHNKELENSVREKTKEIVNTRLEVIQKLSRAAEFKDYATGKHIERVSKFSYIIAKEYGLNETQCELIQNASAMHDVGKIGIPDHILKKQGKLTVEEFEIIKKHSEIGGNIIGESSDDLINTGRIIALQHHEKWNGNGYPKGLTGENINIYARITTVADVFDALTNMRSYKDAWSNEASLDWLKSESGKHFDPKVLDAFLRAFPKIIEVQNKYKD